MDNNDRYHHSVSVLIPVGEIEVAPHNEILRLRILTGKSAAAGIKAQAFTVYRVLIEKLSHCELHKRHLSDYSGVQCLIKLIIHGIGHFI